MKTLILSAMIAAIAGSASAASSLYHERPESRLGTASAQKAAAATAGSVYLTSKDLRRSGFAASDVIRVTVFPTTNIVEPNRRDD